MKYWYGGLLVPGLLVALVVATAPGQAAEKTDKEGWEQLFNGKDLTGWVYSAAKGKSLDGQTETPDKRFQVVDGIIVANEGKGIKDLYTAKAFNGPFHLKMEFRASLKSDSGVYVRGPQLQVRDFIRRNEHPNLKGKFKDDDWNESDITVGSLTTQTKLNGKALTEKDALELTFTNGKLVAKLNGKEIDVTKLEKGAAVPTVCRLNGEQFDKGFQAGLKGGIGLQAETGKFEFRNIRIKTQP